MSTAAEKRKARLLKNAEVTPIGLKIRGESVKGKQKLVTVNSTPKGTVKKRMMEACFGVMSAGVAIGLYDSWTPDMVHVAYPLLGVGITYYLLSYLTRME